MFRASGDRGAPRVLSHFRIGRLLGTGGMGSVYLATDRRDEGPVAVKLLHPDLSEDPTFRARFEQEAHIAALLRSPYTVHIVEHGVVRGQCFIAMEYVQGETLKEALAEGPFAPSRAVPIAVQVARALEEAEARGVVHRDVKPANILLRGNDSVKVTDFGIARYMNIASVTAPGALVGTPSYAAPEQLLGAADHRSDIYALGATLYHMLAGHPPFGGDLQQMLVALRDSPPPLAPLATISGELREIVQRCLEKNPADRYQSASELAGALTLVERDETGTVDETGTFADGATFALAERPSRRAVSLQLKRRKVRLPFARRLRPAVYDLAVHNDSDVVVDLRLRVEDDGAAMRLDAIERMSVLPLATGNATVKVHPRTRRWRGASETHIFTVYGSAGGGRPPVAIAGQYTDEPYGWLPLAAVASVLAIAGASAFAALWFGGASADSEPEPSPLKIGIILPTSNVFADLGAANLNAARVAVNEINKDGGVLGHPIQLIKADSAGDPETAVAEARRLIEDEGVQAIISEDWDHISWQVAEQATEPNNVLHLSTGRPFKQQSERPDAFFRPVVSEVSQGRVMARLAERRGYKNVCAVFMSDSDDTFARLNGAFSASAPDITVRPNAYDDFLRPFPGIGGPVGPWCAGDDATVFFLWAAFRVQGPDPVQLLTEAATNDVGDLLLIDDLKREDVVGKVGWELMDGAHGTQLSLPNQEPYNAFVQEFSLLFGGFPSLPYQTYFGVPYDSVYLIALAAERARTTDPLAMRDAMRDVANEPGTVVTPGKASFSSAKRILSEGGDIDYEGASGPIHLDENGDNTRSNVAFWRVDGQTHEFIIEQRFLFDTEADTLTENTTTSTAETRKSANATTAPE